MQSHNVDTAIKNWYVVYVKSRHEFVTHDELTRRGVESYLPSIKKFRQWSDRKALIEVPLFPGYLFVNVRPNADDFLGVLKTRGAVSLLSLIPGHPTPLPAEEIYSLRLLVESGNELDIYPFLKEGAPVRIKRGPLTGAEGILSKKEDPYMFLVTIEILGRSVGVKIYADDLEAA
jgi:transcription antitermination factor NusG